MDGTPDGVVQEIWALLCAYHAVRELISAAAALARQDPLRICFINALDVVAARSGTRALFSARADRPGPAGAGRSGPGASWPDAPSRHARTGAGPTQPFIAYSATQATVMVSMVPLGCAEAWFCDCRVRFMGMVGH